MRKSFILHLDSLEILSELTDEQAGQLFKAIHQHNIGQTPQLDGLMKVIFLPFKNQMERDEVKYLEKSEGKIKAGLLGNLKKWHSDLYDKYKAGIMTSDQAIEQMNNRIKSQSVANAINPSQSVAEIADSKNDSKNKKDSDSVSIPMPVFVEEIKDDLDPDFYAYLQTREQLKTEIELLGHFANKANTYFKLVQAVPLFDQKLKHMKGMSEQQIAKGITDWLKFNTIKKAKVTWENYAEMAQHCVNFILKPKT